MRSQGSTSLVRVHRILDTPRCCLSSFDRDQNHPRRPLRIYLHPEARLLAQSRRRLLGTVRSRNDIVPPTDYPLEHVSSQLMTLAARQCVAFFVPVVASHSSRHDLSRRGKSHPNTFWYESRRLRWNSFCCTAPLAKAATCSSVRRLSFGSFIHSRMIFRRVSCSSISRTSICCSGTASP